MKITLPSGTNLLVNQKRNIIELVNIKTGEIYEQTPKQFEQNIKLWKVFIT